MKLKFVETARRARRSGRKSDFLFSDLLLNFCEVNSAALAAARGASGFGAKAFINHRPQVNDGSHENDDYESLLKHGVKLTIHCQKSVSRKIISHYKNLTSRPEADAIAFFRTTIWVVCGVFSLLRRSEQHGTHVELPANCKPLSNAKELFRHGLSKYYARKKQRDN